MNIGVYSGTFDPFTNGHLWITKESLRLFDKVVLLIGHHPKKVNLFTEQERLLMISEVVKGLSDKPIKVEILKGSIADYVFKQLDEVTLIRGIRNDTDLGMEMNIANHHGNNEIHSIMLLAPESIKNVSSSSIKKWCKCGLRKQVFNAVPIQVYNALAKHSSWTPKTNWKVLTPKVASMFETTTAGFGPSLSGHTIEMTDEYEIKGLLKEADRYLKGAKQDKTHYFFELLRKNGLLNLTQRITRQQVRELLDPFPVDVTASEHYTLQEISINSVEPFGGRYQMKSLSMGPVIVDINETCQRDRFTGRLFGPAVVIEGKHRWLDARNRGDRKIWAWVGEKAEKLI